VAEGFNIGADQLFINFLYLAAYVVPLAVLGYYLLEWREVASSS
jgi:hypothetical protein